MPEIDRKKEIRRHILYCRLGMEEKTTRAKKMFVVNYSENIRFMACKMQFLREKAE